MNSSVKLAPVSPSTAVVEKMKLLLVDDDQDNLLALQAILEPLGEELLLATSGTAALGLCLEHDFAAILLDVRMPGMDGFETADMIRSRRRSRQTPILFLTAYRSDEQLFRGYDLGAVDFLFKPIVPEVLQSKVAVFVELSRSAQLQRQQAEAIARTEQQLRSVLEAAPDAMVITNADGVITMANSSTDAMFGYTREQLLSFNIRSLIPNWEPAAIVTATEQASICQGMSRVPSALESRVSAIHCDGTSFPAQITMSPFRSDSLTFITTAIRDATFQVEAEERIQRVNLELEKRVADRTADLKRSNEALRQFAWAASHDLQEPIRMVLSYSQWLERSASAKLTQQESMMLNTVQENGRRLQLLLDSLRQYIYIAESGATTYAEIDCNTALCTAINNLSGMITESGTSITSDRLPTVQAVEVILIQLFQNLFSNAIKYRSAEPPKIHVSARDTGPAWQFAVADNGIGIESNYCEYIFGVFRRLHGREYAGTGIGLAICRTAVESLGGRIWVTSELGRGSVFHFLLPKQRRV